MLRLRKVKSESKQVGTIYHVCTPRSTIYNLTKNIITPGSESNYVKGKKKGRGVSFTRDKSYIVDTVDHEPFLFQFVLDGDLLSNSKKIEPYSAPDYDGIEKEEMVFGEVRGLKNYLQGINVIINVNNCSSVEFPTVIEALEDVQKANVKSSIIITGSFNPFSKVQTTIPKDLPSLISLCKKVSAYHSPSMVEAMASLLGKFFDSSVRKYRDSIIKNHYLDTLVSVLDTPKYLSYYKDEISALVDTIKEELNATSIIITEDKYNGKSQKRHGDYKLSYLLNSRYYMLEAIYVSPTFDWMYSLSPYIQLKVSSISSSNRSNTNSKSYYIYFV